MNYERIYFELLKSAEGRTKNKNYQRHHIIPRYMGEDNSPENLVYLTFREHCLIHRLRWKIHGNIQDKVAYRFMQGMINDETHKLYAALGGKKQGAENARTGYINKIKTFDSMSKGGKAGVETQRKNKTGAFFNPEEHRRIAKMGGRAQGIKNAASGHLKTISALSKRNTGKIWITNGKDNKMQEKDDLIELGWKKGRIIKCRNKKN